MQRVGGTAPGRGRQLWDGLGESRHWRLNQRVQHRPGEGGLRPQRGTGSTRGSGSPNSPIGRVMGGSGSPRMEQAPAPAGAIARDGPLQTPPQSLSMPLKHMYRGRTQYSANSGAQYPIRRAAIHQTVRDKKHKRFGINVEAKMNINLQSSTKTMGSKEIDITNSPCSIRLGSHPPQTPIANRDLKDKSSCRRALPLSCPSDAST